MRFLIVGVNLSAQDQLPQYDRIVVFFIMGRLDERQRAWARLPPGGVLQGGLPAWEAAGLPVDRLAPAVGAVAAARRL